MRSSFNKNELYQSPTISVVISCYNYAQYLGACLESAIKQTFKAIEIIVIDDGSTDNTNEVVKPYLSDPRVRYIYQNNKGQAYAKNTGIRNTRGEFIAFLDADDYWETTKLEKQMALFNDPLVGVVYSTARYIDDQGNSKRIRIQMKYLQPREGLITRYMIFDNFVPFSSSVVRREVFQKVGIFDESLRMAIDWDLWLRVSVHYRFQYVKEPLLFYRVGHPGQMSKNLEVRQACTDKIIKRFIEENPTHVSLTQKRQVHHYTLMNRGLYFREMNLTRSTQNFFKALLQWPFSGGVYRSLLKNLQLYLARAF